MMHIDEYLVSLAANAGVTIRYATISDDRDGEYIHRLRLIRLRPNMPCRLHRSVLAHELAHAAFGHVTSKFGPVNAKQERIADEWAALRLIPLDAYRAAEANCDGHVGAMALELGVMRSIVEAFQRLLLRTDTSVYVKPRMGAGNYRHRITAEQY